MFPNRIICRTDFMFEICFKNTYYGLVSYPSVFNVFWLEEPFGDSEGFFILKSDIYHFLNILILVILIITINYLNDKNTPTYLSFIFSNI